jgi:hypothetical protein
LWQGDIWKQPVDFNDLVEGYSPPDKPSPLKRDLDDLGISWDDLAQHVGTALRGRPATVLTLGSIRPLTEEEVALGAELRAQQRVPTSAPPEILRLRSRHHLIAQLLATGLKPTEVAFKMGYSISRISVLQADPMFKELLANYQGLQENREIDVRERLRLISIEAIDELQQRFDEKPSEFDNKELFTLAELSLDRTGFGKSAVISHQYGLDPETAALIKAQRPAARTANLLEGEQLVIDHQERSDCAPETAGQLDLFALPVSDSAPEKGEAPRRAYESAIPAAEALADTGGEVELGAEIGTTVSTAVYVEDRPTGTVVQFRSARSGDGAPESVGPVP